MNGSENKPSVSVLIPCYNQEQHIKNTVKAILNQSYPPDEIIIVDDCSTDRSVEIIKKLPVKFFIHEINKGPSATRNTALMKSSGDVVIYVDADAYADKSMIASILEAYKIIPNDNLAGVSGRGIEVNINNIYDRWRSVHAKQDFGIKLRDNVPFPHGLCMSFYRNKLLLVGGFDTYFRINAGEDYDIGLRLKKAGYWLRYTPKAIVYHQHTDNNESVIKVQYNWYYWSYKANNRNRTQSWRLIPGIIRRLFFDIFTDFVLYNDRKLAFLSIKIFFVRIKAIYDAIKQ